MKLRARAKRLKWAASRHPAMAPLPPGSWFVNVPPSIAYDLALNADQTAIVSWGRQSGKATIIKAMRGNLLGEVCGVKIRSTTPEGHKRDVSARHQ